MGKGGRKLRNRRIRSVETVIGWLFDPRDVDRFAREQGQDDKSSPQRGEE